MEEKEEKRLVEKVIESIEKFKESGNVKSINELSNIIFTAFKDNMNTVSSIEFFLYGLIKSVNSYNKDIIQSIEDCVKFRQIETIEELQAECFTNEALVSVLLKYFNSTFFKDD